MATNIIILRRQLAHLENVLSSAIGNLKGRVQEEIENLKADIKALGTNKFRDCQMEKTM